MESLEEVKIEEPITKKDPKRVEQGKKLAAISKQAKEEKMRKKINQENFSYFPYIIYTVAGLSTFGFIYLLLFGKKDEEVKLEPVKIIKVSPKKQAKFQNFD